MMLCTLLRAMCRQLHSMLFYICQVCETPRKLMVNPRYFPGEGAMRGQSSVGYLLHRYTFGQISGLVDIALQRECTVVGEQLQRDTHYRALG